MIPPSRWRAAPAETSQKDESSAGYSVVVWRPVRERAILAFPAADAPVEHSGAPRLRRMRSEQNAIVHSATIATGVDMSSRIQKS
jgi:hypothetical protein